MLEHHADLAAAAAAMPVWQLVEPPCRAVADQLAIDPIEPLSMASRWLMQRRKVICLTRRPQDEDDRRRNVEIDAFEHLDFTKALSTSRA